MIPVMIPQKKGEPKIFRYRRASAAGHDAGGAREAEADREAERDGDGRQRFRHERRLMRAAAGVRGGGRESTG